jgi:tRNA (guanosine-2'-O-)-methyltransferase
MKQNELIDMLAEFVTPNKIELIDQVLANRTRHVTVVLEDIYQDQNASAVIRTCDCFGIQDLHITEDLHDYAVNPNVVRGASKWITMHRYPKGKDSIVTCINTLKNDNYRVVGTTPDPSFTSIYELNVSAKTAIIFGTEKRGMSDYAKENVDELVHIPMLGFTESFNISVSAALVLSEISQRLRSSELNWSLTEEEKQALRFSWYKQIVKRSDLLINNYLKEHS